MRRSFPIAIAALLLAALPLAASEPPAATLAQLEKALERSDAASAGRPMIVKTHAVISKPNGREREEIVTESRPRADGMLETTVVSATKDGQDVTAEKRAEQAKREAEDAKRTKAPKKEREKEKEKEKDGEVSLGLKVPSGKDRKLFVFSEPTAEGALLVAAYEPARGAKGDDLSRGRVAWSPETGEPAWIEARYVDPPTGIKEFLLRAEFAGAGDAIAMRLMRTTGVGGLLWIKRKFDITVEMTPLQAP